MPATLNSFFSFLSAIIPIKVQKRARASSNFARNSDKFGRKFGAVGVLGGREYFGGVAGARTKRGRGGRGLPLCAFSVSDEFFLLSAKRRFFGGFYLAAGMVLQNFGTAHSARCYIPSPSFFARASARSRTAFSARSISAFRAAMFSFAIFERSASVYKNAPSKLPHVGSIL